ncbi:DUF4345 domain-containing protein [Pseudoxanthomonas sp. PXM02]|uniref:DUF4345 domain-containing protein n=1 Tax=Pseudoxanthomonas sp. PXM02 TaxID=2769294 RepID=UPI0017859D2A|nr:DUF4345 domain-containing protein [Pseudoxanthomonas sp. PXM02]
MAAAYLYLNAVIYLLLACWCVLAPARTAAAVGYASLTRSGQVEYLSIYGGLQFGLAFLFAWFAWSQQMRTGLVLALALYVPIVLFRGIGLLRWWPVEPTTLALAAVEWLMLAAALWLWCQGRPG